MSAPNVVKRRNAHRFMCSCGKGLLGNVPISGQVVPANDDYPEDRYLILLLCRACDRITRVWFPLNVEGVDSQRSQDRHA